MNDTGLTNDSTDDMVALEGDRNDGFDTVRFGGYDKAQVDDYLERVNASLDEADLRHAEDGERLNALQIEVELVQQGLAEAERRASGQPEPASSVAGRMTQMLQLAEQEAAELRERAASESQNLVTTAKAQAAKESEDLLTDIQRRERELSKVAEAAEVTTVQARRDAEVVRVQAKREADNALVIAKREAEGTRVAAKRDAEKELDQARQDVQGMHEQARRDAAATAAEARRELEQLSRQRDAIRAQLQQLNDAVAAAMAPLAAARAADPVESARPGPQAGPNRI